MTLVKKKGLKWKLSFAIFEGIWTAEETDYGLTEKFDVFKALKLFRFLMIMTNYCLPMLS